MGDVGNSVTHFKQEIPPFIVKFKVHSRVSFLRVILAPSARKQNLIQLYMRG